MKLLLLFASQPLYGQVLPGLVPSLQPFQAALLYHAMLRDQLSAAAEDPDLKVRICFAPGLLPGSFEGDLQWELQRGDTVEQRLRYAFASAFSSGASAVLAAGHEAKLLPSAVIADAFEKLMQHSMVAGPGLLGFSRPLATLYGVDPRLAKLTAQAFGLSFGAVKGHLSFEDYGILVTQLKQNPGLAPLSAIALASMA